VQSLPENQMVALTSARVTRFLTTGSSFFSLSLYFFLSVCSLFFYSSSLLFFFSFYFDLNLTVEETKKK